MTLFRSMFALASILSAGLLPQCGRAAEEPAPGRQVAQTITVGEQQVHYLLFLPATYETADKKWPLIVFLHGAGERGDDLELVKKHGPPKIVEKRPDFPFVVVSPQVPLEQRWKPDVVAAVTDHVAKQFKIDQDQIYLTGLSMGGFGTWATAAEYPEKYDAIVPICGGGDPETAEKLKSIPIWVFHGAKDQAVALERSQEMVDAVKAAGGNVKFTVYPEAGHDSWTETYRNPNLYEWLIKQEKLPAENAR